MTIANSTFEAIIPTPFPHPAVCEWGEDRYGLWQSFNWYGIRQTFRWIVPGTFQMGSPAEEKGRFDDNETQHWVTLTKGFWLADTTVTQALWQAVMKDNPSHFQDPQHPVEQISWYEIQTFFENIQHEEKAIELCLPSEAQWEYACRAGSTTPFYFGHELNLQLAHYSGDWENYSVKGSTCPVKQFSPNAWGLYQMHGNVWEWCNDWYSRSYQETVDPTGPKEPDLLEEDKFQGKACRVLRGGSWNYAGRFLRSASRNVFRPGFRNDIVGFRVALGQASSKRGGATSKNK